ncbi:helix-turn-helix transcriptional regulator [Pseudomonas weihenstephanensis]|uniref:helix-turn-helix transcriptional regulator n=1 Tax=Pseudomonas weihenstephanensis TaxID=1608994 RepID=UPI00193C56EA|nr:AraC family transcriptional regulator [Pseudomonas weihenstephanensis]MBM1190905.1 helix-turn-helix transcriptional regulator [Pseudomonas weihenstephanensis]
MQGASLRGQRITQCRWCIPAFEFMSNTEEGIVVLIEGSLTVQDVNTTLSLAPGELIFARRGNYVVSTGGQETRVLWIPLSVTRLQSFVQRFGALLSEVERCEEPGSGMIAFASTPLLADCIKGLKGLLVHEHPPALAVLRTEELLMLLAFSPQGPALMAVLRQQGNRHVERLQAFMETHYLQEWRLSEFAREFGMGLTTFKELFGSVYGVSPRAWISERRILYAHHLLLNTEMSIVDIAMESGFSSQSYFTQSYRRRFACTPSRSRQGKE